MNDLARAKGPLAVVPAAAPAALPELPPRALPAAPLPGRPPGAASGLAPPLPQRAPARPARMRRRHWGVLLSFILCVLAPVGCVATYLWEVAEDQFASYLAFSVRREEATGGIALLGGLTGLSASSTPDSDVLYDFIRSQPMVAAIDARLDLRSLYARPDDPVFGLADGATIEDLTRYWQRMVRVYYDSGSGLIEIRAQAFAPDDARRIAEAVFDESSAMINALSSIARDDATRYTRQMLDTAEAELRAARQALTVFRAQSQIVDPAADIQGRMALLNALEEQLIEARVDLDILRDTTRENDQRILQAERRAAVLEARISEERARFGIGAGAEGGDGDYASLVAEFERLTVDLKFAEEAWLAARAAHDAAVAEAQRQSRYLAAHVRPTEAERAEYPDRPTLLGLVAAAAFLAWAVSVLVVYSLRDRR